MDDDDPPQLPVIVPNSVHGGVQSDALNGEIPAVVSITRVPARPKAPEVQQGIKVRTDLGAPKQGPPPLLRVAGPSRPSLPPMPRLKLGGQRGAGPTGPRFPQHQQSQQNPLNGMLNMMRNNMQATSQGMMQGSMISPPMNHMMGINNQHQMGLPVIAGTMSLRNLRPKAPVPSVSPRLPQTQMQRPPRQMAAFIPQTSPAPTTRPVQVRTVFVPPPMKMKSSSGLTPVSSNGNSGPKMINSFPLNIPVSLPISPGISITPLANGKSNGIGNNAPINEVNNILFLF